MNEPPLNVSVSVILASFNSDEFLSETIESVLAQTHQDFELIVVDDHSSDNSVDLISSYSAKDSRIKLIALTENSGGPAHPRNVGIELAVNDYIAFIDSDDIWHPGKLRVQLSEMRSNKLNFSSTRLVSFKDANDIEFGDCESSHVSNVVSLDKLLKKNIFAASSVMIERSAIDSVRFSELKKHVAVEDYKAWLELHQDKSIVSARLEAKLVHYRVRADSISRSKLSMARKIYALLSEIELNGKKLGFKRYYYFLTYLIGALASSMYS